MMTNDDSEKIDSAQIGKMFVTGVTFKWQASGQEYDEKTGKYNQRKGAWVIQATLSDKPDSYGSLQTMSLKVEQGIGEKIVEVLLPVVIADASRKAEQLAEDSKAMMRALGDKTLACLANMPEKG